MVNLISLGTNNTTPNKPSQKLNVNPFIDVYKTLNTLTWKGMELPCASFEYSFDQEFAEHKYLFRDEALIESLRRSNQRFHYVIPFRENLRKFVNAYTNLFADFVKSCADDRDPGELIDPILGIFNAKVTFIRYRGEANKGRDGVDLEVEFISVPPEGQSAIEPQITIQTAQSDAALLDTQISSIDWKQVPKPTSLTNVLNVVSSVSDQALMNINKYGAYLDKVKFECDKTVDSLHALGDVKNWTAVQAALRLKSSVVNAKAQLGSDGKTIKQYIVPQDTTVLALASNLKMQKTDFLKLNPSLRSPKVRAHKQVFYLV